MGREATKAVGNVWYEARKKAAEYDSRLASREGAAEQLGMSTSALADAELGLSKYADMDATLALLSSSGNGQTGGGGTYVLPVATETTLGGVKIGEGLTVTPDGTASVEGVPIAEGEKATVEATNAVLSAVLPPMPSTSSPMPSVQRRTLPRPTSLRQKLPMRPATLCA